MLFHPISKDNQILRLLLASLISVSIATAQQSNCSLRLDRLPDAPELRGFHMGMTYDQVKSRVPQIQFGRVDELGVSKTSTSPFSIRALTKQALPMCVPFRSTSLTAS